MGEEIVLCPSNFAVVCRSEVELSIVPKMGRLGTSRNRAEKSREHRHERNRKVPHRRSSTTTAANTPRVNSSPQHCKICERGATSQLLDVGGVIPRVPVGRLLPKQSAQNKIEVG